MQGYKFISATLSSSVPLFLKVSYIKIATTFNKTLIFYQINLKFQILYSPLCILPLTHDPAPLKILLSILKTSPLLINLFLMWLKLPLTLLSKTSLTYPKNNLMKILQCWIKNVTNELKNFFITTQRHSAPQRLSRISKNILPNFYQK